MSSKPSRREVLAKGVIAGAMLAAPLPLLAQADHPVEQTTALDGEAAKLYEEQRKSIEMRSTDRLRTPLPENSEPCFIYVPTPKGGR